MKIKLWDWMVPTHKWAQTHHLTDGTEREWCEVRSLPDGGIRYVKWVDQNKVAAAMEQFHTNKRWVCIDLEWCNDGFYRTFRRGDWARSEIKPGQIFPVKCVMVYPNDGGVVKTFTGTSTLMRPQLYPVPMIDPDGKQHMLHMVALQTFWGGLPPQNQERYYYACENSTGIVWGMVRWEMWHPLPDGTWTREHQTPLLTHLVEGVATIPDLGLVSETIKPAGIRSGYYR